MGQKMLALKHAWQRKFSSFRYASILSESTEDVSDVTTISMEDTQKDSISRRIWRRTLSHWKYMSTPPRSGASDTAYLDGLRGFAALMVYMLHNELTAHEDTNAFIRYIQDYGTGGDRILITLPIIRIFFVGGHLAVAIFFVLSGYVLSSKSLLSIRNNDGRLSEILSSAIFRRWFRLFLPTIPITLLFAIWPHATGILPFSGYKPEPTCATELVRWYTEFKGLTSILAAFVFPFFRYGGQMWTLVYELKGSVFIFISCLAFSHSSVRARMAFYITGVVYLCYITDCVNYACFLAGMMLREIDFLSDADELPRWMVPTHRFFRPFVFHTTLLLGLVIGGCPTASGKIEDLRQTPFWRLLSFFSPSALSDYRYFYLGMGATLIVFSTRRIPWLKRFFELPFLQYLGRISFMLYMLHEIILGTLGERIYTALGFSRREQEVNMPGWIDVLAMPRWGPEGMELSFFLGQMVLFPLNLLVADLATVWIDDPCVRFASWLYRQTKPGLGEDGKGLLGSYKEAEEIAMT